MLVWPEVRGTALHRSQSLAGSIGAHLVPVEISLSSAKKEPYSYVSLYLSKQPVLTQRKLAQLAFSKQETAAGEPPPTL